MVICRIELCLLHCAVIWHEENFLILLCFGGFLVKASFSSGFFLVECSSPGLLS